MRKFSILQQETFAGTKKRRKKKLKDSASVSSNDNNPNKSRTPSPPQQCDTATSTTSMTTIVPDEVLQIKQEHKTHHNTQQHQSSHCQTSPQEKPSTSMSYGMDMMTDDSDQLMPINLKTGEKVKCEVERATEVASTASTAPAYGSVDPVEQTASMEYGNAVCKIGKLIFFFSYKLC